MSDTSERITHIWEEYQEGLSYQKRMGYADKFPMYERFRMGDQWAPPTKRTKNLPRPVFNIVEFFIRSKRSAVLNSTLKMIYSPAEQDDTGLAVQAAKDYTDYAASLWKEIHQDDLLEDFVDDAAAYGTGFLHYYWDPDAAGGMNIKYKGDIRGEVIDSLNIFFGEPNKTDLQKQPYILISSRERVDALKETAKANGATAPEIELITSDDADAEGYDAARNGDMEQRQATVITKYYRKNGEVYFSKSTRSVDIIKEQPLTPVPEVIHEEVADYVEGDMLTNTGHAEKITLYPIVALRWNKRKKAMFGTGEIEAILPNQRTINFTVAMLALSVQDHAWPKMLKKRGMVEGDITNVPGEILIDKSFNGDGIKYMQPPNFPAVASSLPNMVLDLTRVTSGVTEVTTGEVIGSNMAASAIIALQNQARGPIDQIQKRFYRCVEETGRIWEQFFKTYYSLPHPVSVDDGADLQTREFIGTDAAEIPFRLNVDVGPGSGYSESLAVNSLDQFYSRGDINFRQYVEYAPRAVVPFREQLLKDLDEAQEQAAQGQIDPGQGMASNLEQLAGSLPEMAGTGPAAQQIQLPRGEEVMENALPGMQL